MRRVVVLVLVGGLLLGACGGGGDEAADTSTSTTSTTEPPAEPIVIRTRVVIAATSGSEPIATGEVLERSTLGDAPFCAGGTILDSHGDADPAVEPYGLIDRTISCPNGTLRIGFTPDETQGLHQTGSWTIVSGTGVFGGAQGSGELEVKYDPNDDAIAHETYTGTVTR
ncbi:MAG: hypothetical protein ABI572_12265 [Actinomycetota bacterium]